jgi:uncharacterized protein (TIGR03435 family)
MKRNEDIEDVLRSDLPLASKYEAESAGVRVLERLQKNPAAAPKRAAASFDHAPHTDWRPVYLLAAAAAIVLAVLIPISVRPPTAASLEIAARDVHFGEVVKSEIFGEVVKLRDGSRIEIKTNSELVLERADDGVRIRLDKGDIVVSAAKQHGHLYVQTQDVTVSVVGTVFYVKAEKEGSRVAVFEGEVHVTQGQTEKKLGPGDQVVSNPKMEAIPATEQVAWIREAATRLALMQKPTPKESTAFEVATIRPAAPASVPTAPGARGGGSDRSPCGRGGMQLDPRRFSAKGLSARELIGIAYGRCANLIVNGSLSTLTGGPDWLTSDKWDIEALIPEGSVDSLPMHPYFGDAVSQLLDGGSPKVQRMIRTMLEERFKLVVRTETRRAPTYALTVIPGGPKFQGNTFDYGIFVSPPPGRASGPDAPKVITAADGAEWAVKNVMPCDKRPGESCHFMAFLNRSMDNVAEGLAGEVERAVINRTGIQGKVSFKIEWPVTRNPPGQRGPFPSQQPSFQLLSQLLAEVGLQLKDEPNWQQEVFVIERVEKPTEN